MGLFAFENLEVWQRVVSFAEKVVLSKERGDSLKKSSYSEP